MQKALGLAREMYSFWTNEICDSQIPLMESGDLRFVQGLSSYKSDLHWNQIGKLD